MILKVNTSTHSSTLPLFLSAPGRISDGAQGHMHMHLCEFQEIVQETSVNGRRKETQRKNKENNIQMEKNEPDMRDERRDNRSKLGQIQKKKRKKSGLTTLEGRETARVAAFLRQSDCSK